MHKEEPINDVLLGVWRLTPLGFPFSPQCKTLELKLEEERVFTEYEQVPKKRVNCIVTTATLPENLERNRFRDVVPYEENRVELVPNKENNTGYINASHIQVRFSSGILTFPLDNLQQCPFWSSVLFFLESESLKWLLGRHNFFPKLQKKVKE